MMGAEGGGRGMMRAEGERDDAGGGRGQRERGMMGAEGERDDGGEGKGRGRREKERCFLNDHVIYSLDKLFTEMFHIYLTPRGAPVVTRQYSHWETVP